MGFNLATGWCGRAAAVLLGLFASAAASADAIDNYTFNGTLASALNGGTSVSGTFSIDVTNSTVTTFDLSSPLGTAVPTNGSAATVTTVAATSPNASLLQLFFAQDPFDYVALYFDTTLAAFSTSASTPLFVDEFTAPSENGYSNVTCFEFSCGFVGTAIFASGVADLVVPAPSVPEPASIAILGAGLAGFGFARRRRTHRMKKYF